MMSIGSDWQTPFTHSEYSQLTLVNEPDGPNTVLIVVAPGGSDAYPKYLVRFSEVFTFTSEEESGTALYLGQSHTPQDHWAYIWPDSPYASAQANTAFGTDKSMRHYVIVGGDDIVSVVCSRTPTIEAIHAPKDLHITYAV